jgi:predicted AlkP superfamily pyrophosphatase or phosphodiesterase
LHPVNRIIGCLGLLLLALALGCDEAPPTAPAKKVQRIMIISLDGARPDVLLRGDAPNVRELCRRGCFTFWAQTIDFTVTLPAHTSMLTGVTPERHGVWTDSDWPRYDRTHPAVPTLFQLAKSAGLTTAMAAGKSKFDSLNVPGSLDWSYVPQYYAPDLQVAQQAVDMIREHRPQVMLVHLPGPDSAGHRSGWGSDPQLESIHEVDSAVGLILNALQQVGLLDETVVIVTADHGGIGYSHWTKDDRTKHIPWIIAGPGIRQNVDLAQYSDLTVNTCDTFATACRLLGISPPGEIDGKPVMQILERNGSPAVDESTADWTPQDDEPTEQDMQPDDMAG